MLLVKDSSDEVCPAPSPAMIGVTGFGPQGVGRVSRGIRHVLASSSSNMGLWRFMADPFVPNVIKQLNAVDESQLFSCQLFQRN